MTIGFIVGAVVLIAVVIASLTNKGELKRLQELKNKRRHGGKRLSPEDQEELDMLLRKYPWY